MTTAMLLPHWTAAVVVVMEMGMGMEMELLKEMSVPLQHYL